MKTEEIERTLFKCPTPEHCTRECPYHHPQKDMCMTYWFAKGAKTVLDKLPSEEELQMIAELEYPTGSDDYLLTKGIELAQVAFNSGVNWLKSKIVK